MQHTKNRKPPEDQLDPCLNCLIALADKCSDWENCPIRNAYLQAMGINDEVKS